ncbi:MAG: hypothetical protein D6772_12895 [Bacteroidetes bacterium]|nr:MAG: hypothetical protein D6772_12895 [Bacteroidota bacterium]
MQKRTMIIIWSWASRGLGEGIWSVAGQSHAGDQVVCRDLRAGPNSLDELQAMIETHQADGQVMVFLHRQHGYHSQHLEKILHHRRTSNSLYCFLFGEGTGPIYLTQEARGLLGTAGTFSARISCEGQEMTRSAIADAAQRQLKPKHFDFVWQRYGAALYEHTLILKEDLFSALAQEPHSSFDYAPGELYQLLKQDRHRELLLRLLSFAGRIRKNSDLEQEILTFERASGRTLTFGNYQAQLVSTQQVEALAAYRRVADYILRQVLSKGATVSLPLIRDLFDDLLSALE